MVEKFYTKTGMYIDWQQLESLPEIDTLIDIGVGVDGTENKNFWKLLRRNFVVSFHYLLNFLFSLFVEQDINIPSYKEIIKKNISNEELQPNIFDL